MCHKEILMASDCWIVPTNPTVTSAMFSLRRTLFLYPATWVQTLKCQTRLTLKTPERGYGGVSESHRKWMGMNLKCPKEVFPVHFYTAQSIFHGEDMHGINRTDEFIIESMKSRIVYILLILSSQYLHKYIFNFHCQNISWSQRNIYLVSRLLTRHAGWVQVTAFRDISLCCFSAFSVMLNIKKVQLGTPPAETRQSQG